MTGTISRWGSKGYGFVFSDELATEAWLHAKFLDDPEYQPRQGDKVEFEAERLPDGRVQARRVRLLTSPYRPRPAEAPAKSGYVYSDANGTSGGFSVKLSLGGLVLPPARVVELPERSQDRGYERPVVDRVLERPFERVAERSMSSAANEPAADVDAAFERARPGVAVAAPELDTLKLGPGEVDCSEGPLGVQLATERRVRQAALSQVQQSLLETRKTLEALRLKEAELAQEIAKREEGVAAADAALIAGYVRGAVLGLERGLDERRRIVEAAEMARRHAIQRSGLPPVEEYEELRARLREAAGKKDAMTEKAFRSFERERRSGLRELADALDRVEAAPPVMARFIAFVGPPSSSLSSVAAAGTTLVAPVRAPLTTGTAGPDRLAVRIALAFWHAAERAARELAGAGAVVEHGQLAGSLAVRVGPFDAGLLPLLLDETWSSRPALEDLGIERGFEVVEGVDPGFEVENLDASGDVEALAAAAGGLPMGASLPDVAERLRLSLHDLVATLYDRGLPFPDDTIDTGTEETLRALLGENHGEPQHAGAPAGSGAAGTEGQPAIAATDGATSDDSDARPEGPLGTASIASRMLRKLLIDRRVGGRHTRIENAYGHHFSDQEKLIARRVAEWLEKEGIFMPKLNEGSHHISINPRRLREVGQIIEGTWERKSQFDEI